MEEKGSLPPPFSSVKIDGNFSKFWNSFLAFLRRLTGNQLHYIMPILALMAAVGIQASVNLDTLGIRITVFE